MPKKIGNGGAGLEAYSQQDGRYTDEGNISQEERKAMNLMGLEQEQKGSFDEYYDDYDEYGWAYDLMQDLIDRNDFGLPDFEELDEEERDEILQEAFVQYIDDGNEFDTSMREYEVLDKMYFYIEDIMYERGL